ncbi:hypothetical protein [Streptomyces sp. NPDC091259]
MGLNDDDDDPWKQWWRRIMRALRRCGPLIALLANLLTVVHGMRVLVAR